MKNWKKILEKAYDKCAMLRPGDDVKLTADEEYILMKVMYGKRRKCLISLAI